jgi:uncharacterized membrane protein YqjE
MALVMSLLDRQGLFYVLLLLPALVLAWARTRRGGGLPSGAAAAIVVWWIYNDLLGPRIIHAVAGYWPDMDFQRLDPTGLLEPAAWRQAVEILGDWTSVLLGGLPPGLLAAGAIGLAVVWMWGERGRPHRLILIGFAGLAVTVAQLAMVALMVLRHPPVTWVGNRLWYYPLPFQAFVVFGLLWGCDRLARRRGRSLPLVAFALAALVVANVARWPEQRVRMHEMPAFAEQLRRSNLLARSLRGGWAAPLLDGDYRRFYFECLDRLPGLAARSLAQAGEGLGIDTVQLRGGRLSAWAAREAQLVPRVPLPGRYVLAGAVWLRPGDRVSIVLGARQRRLLGEIRNDRAVEGVEFFRVEAGLRAGPSDVRLVSTLPEREVRDGLDLERAGFALLPPVAVYSADSRPTPRVDPPLP